MDEIPATISEAGVWLRSGRTTATRLTESLLQRAFAAQDALHAFVSITADSAIATARTIDADFARGVDRGPLQGIPIGIKDIIATVDAPTTANSPALDPAWGDRPDATVIRRLRAAGSVLLGKLTLHEFALGWPDPATGFGIARNPWDPSRTPGGSSTGAGVAVAARLVLGALGSDSSGSIRAPAAFCGVTGIKPTAGRVSRDGSVPLSPTLDSIGPMARSALDCGLVLQVIAGPDPADSSTSRTPVPDMVGSCDGSLQGLRVGVPRSWLDGSSDVDIEVCRAVEDAISLMAEAGATIVEIELPFLEAASAATSVILRREAFVYHEDGLRTRPHLFGKYARRQFLVGAFFTAADYRQAQRIRATVTRAWRAVLADLDVAVTPTMPTTAVSFDGYQVDSSLANVNRAGVFNLTGLPAMSVPNDEPTVVKIGDAYQRLTDWHLRRPPLPGVDLPR